MQLASPTSIRAFQLASRTATSRILKLFSFSRTIYWQERLASYLHRALDVLYLIHCDAVYMDRIFALVDNINSQRKIDSPTNDNVDDEEEKSCVCVCVCRFSNMAKHEGNQGRAWHGKTMSLSLSSLTLVWVFRASFTHWLVFFSQSPPFLFLTFLDSLAA